MKVFIGYFSYMVIWSLETLMGFLSHFGTSYNWMNPFFLSPGVDVSDGQLLLEGMFKKWLKLNVKKTYM